MMVDANKRWKRREMRHKHDRKEKVAIFTHIPSNLASWTNGGCKHQVEVDGICDGVPSNRSFHLVLPEQFRQLLFFVVVNLQAWGGGGIEGKGRVAGRVCLSGGSGGLVWGAANGIAEAGG